MSCFKLLLLDPKTYAQQIVNKQFYENQQPMRFLYFNFKRCVTLITKMRLHSLQGKLFIKYSSFFKFILKLYSLQLILKC